MGLPQEEQDMFASGVRYAQETQHRSPRKCVTGVLGDTSTATWTVAVITSGTLDALMATLPTSLRPSCFLYSMPV